MLLRNGEQLLLAFAIPVGLLLGGLVWGAGLGLDPAVFPASVVAVATWSTAFTAVAVGAFTSPWVSRSAPTASCTRAANCSCPTALAGNRTATW